MSDRATSDHREGGRCPRCSSGLILFFDHVAQRVAWRCGWSMCNYIEGGNA